MDTTNTIAEIRSRLDVMGVKYKARDSKSTLLALYVTATDGKVEDLGNDDTDCGGCENGECDNCGNYACCNEQIADLVEAGVTQAANETLSEKVAEITGEEDTISEWFEKKVGTKWTYIYHNGELIAEVRNDSVKQVMAVLQASA